MSSGSKNLLQHAPCFIHSRRQVPYGLGHHRHITLGIVPLAFLYSFSDPGKCLDAVTRIKTRSIDLVPEPLPIGEPTLVTEESLGSEQELVELLNLLVRIERVGFG